MVIQVTDEMVEAFHFVAINNDPASLESPVRAGIAAVLAIVESKLVDAFCTCDYMEGEAHRPKCLLRTQGVVEH